MASPHFTSEEVQALRCLAVRELARQEEEQRDVQRRAALAEKYEREAAETERLQRAARAIMAAGPSHGAVFDKLGCICAGCIKLREKSMPAFAGWSADVHAD